MFAAGLRDAAAGPGLPTDRVLPAFAARTGQSGPLCAACAVCPRAGTGPAHLSGRGAGIFEPFAYRAGGDIRLLAEGSLQLLYSTLHVQPDGTPAALLLTEECTRATVAVQLLPPFVWEDPLPPLPDTPAALTLQLTMQDVMQADTDPAALGRKLAGTAENKRWLHHPKAETFLAERVALLQRVYKR